MVASQECQQVEANWDRRALGQPARESFFTFVLGSCDSVLRAVLLGRSIREQTVENSCVLDSNISRYCVYCSVCGLAHFPDFAFQKSLK